MTGSAGRAWAFAPAVVALAACAGGATTPSRAPAVVVSPPPAQAGDVAPSTAGLHDAPHGTEVALADSMVCVRVDGRVYCAQDDTPALSSAAPVGGIEDAISMAAGSRFVCIVTRPGKVFCLGDNDSGQLGAGLRADRSDVPVPVLRVAGARRVTAGSRHACALLEGGAVTCWGLNLSGETAGGASYAATVRELALATKVPIPPATAVAASGASTCAFTQRKELFCWGRPALPRHEAAHPGGSEVPWRSPDALDIEDLTGGDEVFCGLRSRTAVCWGSSYSLFSDLRGATREALPLRHLPPVRKVRVASDHGCALAQDGAVLCWGSNHAGALGRETGDDHSETSEPAVVAGMPRAVDVAVGSSMSCAVVDGGDVYCWGTWPGGRTRKDTTPVRLRL